VRIGVGVFLITLGAILAFAVRDSLSGVDLSAVGIILMLAGAAIVALWFLFWSRHAPARRPPQIIEREVPVEREVVVERDRPVETEGPIPPSGSVDGRRAADPRDTP
jgi:hypothetical protein